MKREKTGYSIIIVLALISIIGLFFIPPMEQDPNYHNFCDSKTVFNIPNFWNVVSNVPFLILGLIGVIKALKFTESRTLYIVFFTGIALVSLGSGYYHLNPNNNTLVWDRLPMTIAFMSLFSIVVSEFISPKKGNKLLFPALIIGVFSVLYWQYFNDLRIYALVQFYPILVIPVILIFFSSRYTKTYGYWGLSIAYFIAKVFEHFDKEVDVLLGGISGHPLKHLFASLGILCLLYSYLKRKKVKTSLD